MLPGSVTVIAKMKYWPQIQSLSRQYNLVPELRAQIAKDLGIALAEVPEKELVEWLRNWIEAEANKQDWAQVLYRIDLQIPSAERPEEWALAILEREAQKVIFRAQYSGRI